MSISLLWLGSAVAFGQAYESQPCVADSELKAQLQAGRVIHLGPKGPDSSLVASSSLLAPPANKKPDLFYYDGDPDDYMEDYLMAEDRW